MTDETREQLLNTLEQFSDHYPDWRFGQLISNLASWSDNENWANVTDEQLLAVARLHLAKRFGNRSPEYRSEVDAWHSVRKDLLQVLRELGQQFPEWKLVTVVSRLACIAHVNIYDIEDEKLLDTARVNDSGVQWFEWYGEKLEKHSTILGHCEGVSYPCPCCHHFTLGERGGFEICPVCFWEDDGQDDADADSVRGGPNGSLTLSQGRENYRRYQVYDLKYREHVRPPRPEEQQPITGHGAGTSNN